MVTVRRYIWASALGFGAWAGVAVAAPMLDPDPVAHAPPVVLDSTAWREAAVEALRRLAHPPAYDPAREAALEAAAVRHRTFGRSAFAAATLMAFAALTLLVIPAVRRTLGPGLHPGQVVLLWLVALGAGSLLVYTGLPPLADPDHTTPALFIGPTLLWLTIASIVLPISVTWRWFGARTRRPP